MMELFSVQFCLFLGQDIHSLQVKVILSNRLPPLVIVRSHKAVRQPQETMFTLLLDCQHPNHHNKQNNNNSNPNQVQICCCRSNCWFACLKKQEKTSPNTYWFLFVQFTFYTKRSFYNLFYFQQTQVGKAGQL